MQIQIPLLPISERIRMDEFTAVFENTVNFLYKKFGTVPPILIFEPLAESYLSSAKPYVSEAPEELVVASIGENTTEAIFQALKQVEEREPQYPSESKRKSLKIKDNTPLKNLFRQMAEMPLTVFSFSVPAEADSVSIFFLRTAFTVSEFRREIQQIIIAKESPSSQSN
jgi:hypothetical protein